MLYFTEITTNAILSLKKKISVFQSEKNEQNVISPAGDIYTQVCVCLHPFLTSMCDPLLLIAA